LREAPWPRDRRISNSGPAVSTVLASLFTKKNVTTTLGHSAVRLDTIVLAIFIYFASHLVICETAEQLFRLTSLAPDCICFGIAVSRLTFDPMLSAYINVRLILVQLIRQAIFKMSPIHPRPRLLTYKNDQRRKRFMSPPSSMCAEENFATSADTTQLPEP
jgi:hypothetical protein